MNVFLGQVSAGATWPLPWQAFIKERPDVASELEVKWQTESLLNNGLVVLPDVPPEIVQQVQHLLVTLGETVQGQKILEELGLSCFEVATDATYIPVRDFLTLFAQTVRPIKE